MTDEQAAKEYAAKDGVECLSTRFQETKFGECLYTRCDCNVYDAYLAGAAYKEAQMQERIVELEALYEARSGQDIDSLEARLAWAEGMLKRMVPLIHDELLKVPASARNGSVACILLEEYEAGPTEEGEK